MQHERNGSIFFKSGIYKTSLDLGKLFHFIPKLFKILVIRCFFKRKKVRNKSKIALNFYGGKNSDRSIVIRNGKIVWENGPQIVGIFA